MRYITTLLRLHTDPSPVEGKGFTVFVETEPPTVGGTAYATGKKKLLELVSFRFVA